MMRTHLTNSAIKRIAKQIGRNLNKNNDLVLRIMESNHPKAQQIVDALENEGFLYLVDVETVVNDVLSGED